MTEDKLGCENCKLVKACSDAYNDDVEEKGVESCPKYGQEDDLERIIANMESKLLELGVNQKAVDRMLGKEDELVEGA